MCCSAWPMAAAVVVVVGGASCCRSLSEGERLLYQIPGPGDPTQASLKLKPRTTAGASAVVPQLGNAIRNPAMFLADPQNPGRSTPPPLRLRTLPAFACVRYEEYSLLSDGGVSSSAVFILEFCVERDNRREMFYRLVLIIITGGRLCSCCAKLRRPTSLGR